MEKNTKKQAEEVMQAERETIISALLARTEKDETCKVTAKEREALMFCFGSALPGIGLNSFNSYIAGAGKGGNFNVDVRKLRLTLQFGSLFAESFGTEQSERTFYVTEGKADVHGGQCETYNFALTNDEGKTENVEVWRHLGEGANNGCFIVGGTVRNSRIVSETELREMMAKAENLRQFNVKWGYNTQDMHEEIVAGVLIGNMTAKRQIIVAPTGKGSLRIVSLHTGKVGKAERCNFAVEAGKLAEADIEKLRIELGIALTNRRIAHGAVNLGKRMRKAAKTAGKAVA